VAGAPDPARPVAAWQARRHAARTLPWWGGVLLMLTPLLGVAGYWQWQAWRTAPPAPVAAPRFTPPPAVSPEERTAARPAVCQRSSN